MKSLVIGGTGTVGSQVVRELIHKQQAVRVLVTSVEKAAQLPVGVEAVIGNLEQPATLPKAFQDIDRVILITRPGKTEMAQGLYAVAAAQRAGVRKIVYLSSYNARQAAPCQPKVAIENAIRRTGIAHTFICPTNFYQNDFWFKDAIILHGLYPQPIGNLGVSRVDANDVAEAATNALLSDDWNGLSIPLAGPDGLTGLDMAEIMSEQLDRRVRYISNNPGVWSAEMASGMPGSNVAYWVGMYRFYQQQGMVASQEDLNLLTDVLGREPRSYAAFLTESANVFSQVAELA